MRLSERDFDKGEKLLRESLIAPFNQICQNAGVDANADLRRFAY